MTANGTTFLLTLHKQRFTILGAVVLICAVLLLIQARPPFQKAKTIRVISNTLPTLAPHEHDDKKNQVGDVGHAEYLYGYATTTEDLWVTDITFSVHNAPMSVVHHSGLFSIADTPDSECPGNQNIHWYSLRGSDSPSGWTFPRPYGIFLPKGTAMHNLTMLHNARPPAGRGGTYHDVSTEFVLTVLPSGAGRTVPVRAIDIALQDQPYCYQSKEGPTFTVPANTPDYKREPTSAELDRGRYVFAQNGRIIGADAHTHSWEGGGPIDFLLNGKVLRTYTPERNEEEGRLWLMPAPPLSQAVHAGDAVSITALYHNPGKEPVLGAMGIVLFYYADE